MYSRFPSRPPRPMGGTGDRRSLPLTPPPNYSGHAFSDRISPHDTSMRPSEPDLRPHPEELPHIRALAHPEEALPPDIPPEATERGEPADVPCAPTEKKQPPPPVPGFPGLFSPHHFPFGHGLGQEELLLLGLLLFLLHEDDGGHTDLGETVLLIGILLLCG